MTAHREPGRATTRIERGARVRAEDTGLASPEKQDPGRQVAIGIARGAALIAAVTIFSRILGLVRTLVFSQAIGATCLGSAYLTAYQVPNLIAELALGGTLTSALVPVLARLAARADTDPEEKARIGQICSALLTWALIILVPVALIIVAGAGTIASGLTPANAHSSCPHSDVVHVTTGMIQVFAPQVVMYGIAVVLIGLLQAYRKFGGPAVAPILVSLVLIASYLGFSSLNQGRPLSRIPLTAELALSVGATLGIAALLITLIVPTWRLHMRFRLTLGLPPEIARRVGALVTVGIIEFLATSVSSLVVIVLANGRGTTGALVLFNYSFLVFSAMYAVLATSIVTSAFPALSSQEGEQLDRASAGSTRAVLLMSWLGVAMIAAVAVPAAHVLAKHSDQVPQLVTGFLLFAPGIAGQAVIANLSRLMLAIGRFKLAALSLGGSWLVVIVADVVLVELVPAHLVVGALALGNTIGQTLVAIPVVIMTRRIRGGAALQGVRRAWLAGLGAAAVGAAVGLIVAAGLHVNGKLLSAGTAVVATCCAIVAYGVAVYVLDRQDARTVTLRLRQFARQRLG
jgi:putative peptidoglycan lipid II flippase